MKAAARLSEAVTDPLTTPVAPPAIEFDVTYDAAEYRGIALDYVRSEGHRPGWFGRAFLYACATLSFACKSRRVGSCSFRVDEAGLRRRSRVGEMTIGWDRVKRVRRLSSCYLVELRKGGLPIPYRCLDAAARAAFERFAASVLSA